MSDAGPIGPLVFACIEVDSSGMLEEYGATIEKLRASV